MGLEQPLCRRPHLLSLRRRPGRGRGGLHGHAGRLHHERHFGSGAALPERQRPARQPRHGLHLCPQGSAVQPVTLYLPGQPPFLKVRSSSAFDAFGSLRAAATADAADTFDPVGFGGQQGYYWDYTGLYLLTHRYYDAGAGRFVTRDPIGYTGGINLYGFAGNNPVNESDPDGTQAENGPNLLMPPLYDQNPAGPVYDGSAANSQEHPSTAAVLSGRAGHSTKVYRTSPLPESYINRNHTVNMSRAPRNSGVNAAGHPRNGPWFWLQLLSQHPELFDATNAARVRARRSPVVNAQWSRHNPTHVGFDGDKLISSY